MADSWYVRKRDGVVTGPFTSQQLKRMADEGEIDDHTPVGKAEGGPFTLAGRVKGLTPPMATPTGPLPKYKGESILDSVEIARKGAKGAEDPKPKAGP